MNQAAMDYLLKEKLININIIEAIKRGSGKILSADEAGVLVYDCRARLYLLSAQTAKRVWSMLPFIQGAAMAVVSSVFAADILTQRLMLHTIMKCHQTLWEHSDPPEIENKLLKFEVLGMDMAQEIKKIYTHDTSLEYIKGRIANKEMFGAFLSGEMAGFIALHEEYSMGMLEVLPKFRRMGVGSSLTAFLCGYQLERGQVPFAQFVADNSASRKMQEKLGFSISKGCIYWMKQ